MGDISELRGLVTVGAFLATLVFLISLIPSDFLISAYEGRTIEAPEDYWEAIDLAKFATTWNYTLDGTDTNELGWYGWMHMKKIGGHDFEVVYAKPYQTLPSSWGGGVFSFWHYFYWWVFPTGEHQMSSFNKKGVDRGISLTRQELDDDYVDTRLEYTFQCDHVSINIFFAFNETTYSTPSEAFDDSNLKIMTGLEWDQVSTSMSAWDIIGMLLFFQLPNVHWVVNALIAVPMWLTIGYLSFIFILRAVGAIFGGGA